MCVTGIIGLQLFWNYQNYKTTVKNFDHDINEALNKAADREIDQRQQQIATRFKSWMADTTLITITCSLNEHYGNTVFHVKDTHPKYKDQNGFSFGLSSFTKKLTQITPAAKVVVINHVTDRMLRDDLKKGTVYFYTQRLGDSLTKVFEASKAAPVALSRFLKQELAVRNIYSSFVLNPPTNTQLYLSKVVNTNFRRPYQQDMVSIGFEDPNTYFLKKMKWIVIGSFLLIGITLCCFGYTVKTLLSQQKLAMLKDDFINNMTHELNTPISSIKITAEALKSFKHNPETQSEYLDIISYQAEKLTDLTTQVLNTGRLINTDKTHWTGINLNELLQQAIDDLKPQFDKHQALVNYHPLQPAPHIKGDAQGLLSAFTNIIDNALKYTTDIANINITLSSPNGYAQIAFADNGIGIPPGYREKVFEKFFRVPQGNLHNVTGYGLGLSYVSQVIGQHNGAVSVSANQPQGSIITLKIPLANG